MNKKQTRNQFRNAVFKRDGYRCRCCSKKGRCRQTGETIHSGELVSLDAHHIIDRSLMPNGGYTASNGVSLCDDCHLKSEAYWNGGIELPGFSPNDLFLLVGSSEEKAVTDSLKLKAES